MIISKKLSSYLSGEDIRAARYYYYRPVIRFAALFFVIMLGTCFVCQAAWYFYTDQKIKKLNDTNAGTIIYQEAMKIDTELSKRVELARKARPKNIDAKKMLAAIFQDVPKGMSFTAISISPEKTSVSGSADNIDIVNAFCNVVSNDHQKAVMDFVENKDNKTKFVISIARKEAAATKEGSGK